jgi:hypothetical protein
LGELYIKVISGVYIPGEGALEVSEDVNSGNSGNSGNSVSDEVGTSNSKCVVRPVRYNSAKKHTWFFLCRLLFCGLTLALAY